MKFIPLNMVWPAIYIADEVSKFWFLIFATILIEIFTIKYLMKITWIKSLIASIIGNLLSGFIGTTIMMFAMIIWHFFFDWILPHATFDIFNWIMSYILMCFGSVLIEVIVIRFIYKLNFKKLFIAMLVGNVMSYSFIAVVMVKKEKDSRSVRQEKYKYLPNKQDFILLDNTKLHIDTAIISIHFNHNGERLNIGPSLQIPFEQEKKENFQFDLKKIGEKFSEGINENIKEINVEKIENQFHILMEQKNPDTSFGWKKPIITDTIIFNRIKDCSH